MNRPADPALTKAARNVPAAPSVAAVFNAKAARWDTKGRNVTVVGDDSPVDHMAAEILPIGGTVVDIGGGSGRTLEKLAHRCVGGTMVLVDLSRAMVEAAKARLGRHSGIVLSLLVADGARIPLPPSFADLTLVRQVLQHVPAPAAVIRESARITQPGGNVLVQVPGPAYLATWCPFRQHDHDPIGRFSPAEIHAMFEHSGLAASVSLHRFSFVFPDAAALLKFFLDNSLLDKLSGYDARTSRVLDRLLEQELVARMLAELTRGPILVPAEYVVGVGERRT